MLTSGFNQSSTAAGSVTSKPRGLALSNGQLYIADTNNNRILVMKTPVASGDIPVRVYGQPDDLLALANSGGSPSAHTVNQPRGVFADATHVIISDTGNNRVLVFDPSLTSADATLVLGQKDFSSVALNAGGPSLATLQQPTGAFTDGTALFVADTGNHRVLIWSQFPTANGQPADVVLGQATPSDILSNRGVPAAVGNSMSFPAAIEEINGVVFVADSGNNRVLMFSTVPKTSGVAADGVLGQADLTSRTAAALSDDLTRLAGPVAMAYDGTNLYVTDRDLARVVAYHAATLSSTSSAFISLGAGGGLSLRGPGGVVAERTPYFTSRVYIADTGNDQLTLLASVSRITTP
jgi:sugar lactone lactonase YvrE